MGWSEVREADGSVVIQETFTCCHCNRIKDAVFRGDVHMCHPCMKRVCNECHAIGTCTPFEKKLGMYERKANEILGADGIERAQHERAARRALCAAVGILD